MLDCFIVFMDKLIIPVNRFASIKTEHDSKYVKIGINPCIYLVVVFGSSFSIDLAFQLNNDILSRFLVNNLQAVLTL